MCLNNTSNFALPYCKCSNHAKPKKQVGNVGLHTIESIWRLLDHTCLCFGSQEPPEDLQVLVFQETIQVLKRFNTNHLIFKK